MIWQKTEQIPYKAAEWPPCSGCGRRVPTVTTPTIDDRLSAYSRVYHVYVYPVLCMKCLSEAIATLSE